MLIIMIESGEYFSGQVTNKQKLGGELRLELDTGDTIIFKLDNKYIVEIANAENIEIEGMREIRDKSIKYYGIINADGKQYQFHTDQFKDSRGIDRRSFCSIRFKRD